MNADKVSVVAAEKVMNGWIVLRLSWRVTVCCRKKMVKEEVEMEEEGRAPSDKLNITNR